VTRRETVSRLVPAPLAGITLLLVVVILLTPVLDSNGPPVAGTLQTQAELIIDRVPGDNATHFYVRGVGTTTRYTQISIKVATGFNWTGTFPSGPLSWTNATNGSDVLTIEWATTDNVVALNISALYQAYGASARYVGVIAFEFTSLSDSSGGTLNSVTATPGLAGTGQTSVSRLPLLLQLVNLGGGP